MMDMRDFQLFNAPKIQELTDKHHQEQMRRAKAQQRLVESGATATEAELDSLSVPTTGSKSPHTCCCPAAAAHDRLGHCGHACCPAAALPLLCCCRFD